MKKKILREFTVTIYTNGMIKWGGLLDFLMKVIGKGITLKWGRK